MNDAFKKIFEYIHTDIIAKAELNMLMQLFRVVIESIKQTGLEINTFTKKNLRRKTDMQFSTSWKCFRTTKERWWLSLIPFPKKNWQ